MGLQATFVLYLVIGVGVEAALVAVREEPPVARWFTTLTGILFWPLYVPILLAPPDETPEATPCRDEGFPTAESSMERPDAVDVEPIVSKVDAPAENPNPRRMTDNRT